MITEADEEYLRDYLGLPDPLPRPAPIGWKCPVCGYVWSPKVDECENCNVSKCDCMEKVVIL